MELSLSGTFTPENFHSLELSLLRTFVPWNFRSLEQGSCTGLEFKAGLEKFLNFIKLKMSLNCFGKRVECLEKFGIRLCETFNKTW